MAFFFIVVSIKREREMSIFIAEGVVLEGETVTACANKTC